MTSFALINLLSGVFVVTRTLVAVLVISCTLSLSAIADTAETSTEQTSPAIDMSDWDWGEVDAMDDTPVSPNQVISKTSEAPSKRLTIDEVTKPDLEAQAHPVYSLFANMPDFEVIPSIKDSEMHPCSNCHQYVTGNPNPRQLDIPHDNFQLEHGLHGKGQFWCFTCHQQDHKLSLKTLDGESVDFKDAYIVCSQCHVNQARDWAYGAHGKRHAVWQGTRQVYNCTACHYQHAPAFKTREAKSGPEIRQGLTRPEHWVPGVRSSKHE